MVLQAAGLQEYIPDIGYVSISLLFHIMACKFEKAHPEHSRNFHALTRPLRYWLSIGFLIAFEPLLMYDFFFLDTLHSYNAS
jgi:hypothetical protein